MPRPNSEGKRIMLIRQKAGNKCCSKSRRLLKEESTCICSTCVTCPLTFVPSHDYTVSPGYIIRKISSDPDATLASMQSYTYQNVRLSLTYTVDISVPEVIVALSPTQSYNDVVYILTINSSGITLQVDSLSITLSQDSMFAPYWIDGRVIQITLTTISGSTSGQTRINLNIDNGDQTGLIEIDLARLFPPFCGFYTIVKAPTEDTTLTINYFGLDRPCS